MGTGARIKEAARAKGVTLRKLAENAGISYNTLYSITKRDSERVDPETVRRIAVALGVEPWKLMGYDGSIRVIPPSDQQRNPLKESLEGLMSTLEKVAKTFPAEDKLNWAMLRLTDSGKNKVADYAIDLVKIPEYRRQDTPEPPPPPSEGKDTAAGQDPAEGQQKPGEGES